MDVRCAPCTRAARFGPCQLHCAIATEAPASCHAFLPPHSPFNPCPHVLGWLIVASQEESVHTKSHKSVAKEAAASMQGTKVEGWG
jgi:hypothetical protein